MLESHRTLPRPPALQSSAHCVGRLGRTCRLGGPRSAALRPLRGAANKPRPSASPLHPTLQAAPRRRPARTCFGPVASSTGERLTPPSSWRRARLGSAAARYPGLLGLARQAPGCAATLPLRYRYVTVTLPLRCRYVAVTLPLQAPGCAVHSASRRLAAQGPAGGCRCAAAVRPGRSRSRSRRFHRPPSTQAIDEDGSGFISEVELTDALMQASGLVAM